MWLARTLMICLPILLNFSQCVKMHMIEEQWRTECLDHFFSSGETKSIGVLYKNDIGADSILKLIANEGISFAIRQVPGENASSVVVKSLLEWKAIGISQIFFLQSLNTKFLGLWSQILDEICDYTWWLFYAEESMKEEFKKTISESSCITNHWFVFSRNCSSRSRNKRLQLRTSQVYYNITKSRNADRQLGNSQRFPKIIRLAVNESPPYLTLKETKDGKIYLAEGSDAKLLRTMAHKMDFEYKILRAPDGEWGRIRRGNWTGLIGMLFRNEADIASGCVTMTYQRYKAASFSFPYDLQESVIITRSPKEKPDTYAVLLPFKLEVWLLILAVLLLFLLLFYAVGFSYNIFYARSPYKFDRIFLYLIGSSCSEGGWLTFVVQGPAAVLLVMLWLSFVLVMQASYCGKLMAVLGFPESEPAIDTLADLAKAISEKGFQCGCMKGTTNCDTMLDLRGNLKVIAASLDSNKQNYVRSVDEGLSKVLNETYAFLGQEIGCIFKAKLMPEPDFYMSNEGLDVELFALGIRRGLPYQQAIDNILTEAGLIAKWRDDITSLNDMQFDTRVNEIAVISPLTLEKLTGAVYLFCYGMIFATTAFVFENIDGRCFNKQGVST